MIFGACTSAPFQHLDREISRGRVRHRVVDVEDVQLGIARDLRHLYRQRQGVIWVGEKAVFVHDHFVKEDSRLAEIETNRLGGTKKMDPVPALRQLRPEGGGEDPALLPPISG